MPVECELAPVFFELKTVSDAEEGGDDPAEWPDEFRGGKLKRLVVENDRALLECVRAEESLEEQKRCT